MGNNSEDQWSSSYFGDDAPETVDICESSVGGRLKSLCSGENDIAVQAARGNPEILEELRLWEKQFPNLAVKGTKIPSENQTSAHDEVTVGTRMMIARRVVINYILPDIQKLLQAELGFSKSLPRLKRVRRSKSSTISGKREQKPTVTLPNL
ncbi:hypothetical protein FO519_003017 [Halicephalobus sp. NKZ332]|nr:hypothetical protein FO519_003017 [Halicephalobus sp. NKZ332]